MTRPASHKHAPKAKRSSQSTARESAKAAPKASKSASRGPGRPSRGVEAETAYPPSARVIKRYGNRRLYDARLSRCVTMAEIADMVRDREDVRIVDGDTGEDLTKRMLVQLILEQQNAAQLEVLPVELLHQIIAVRSQPIAGWLAQYLQAGAEFLDRQSRAAAPAMRGMSDSIGNLFPWLNPEAYKGAADAATAFHQATKPSEPPAPDAESPLGRELAELQRRFADLAARFGRTP